MNALYSVVGLVVNGEGCVCCKASREKEQVVPLTAEIDAEVAVPPRVKPLMRSMDVKVGSPGSYLAIKERYSTQGYFSSTAEPAEEPRPSEHADGDGSVLGGSGGMLWPRSCPPDAMKEPRLSEPGDGPERAGSLLPPRPPDTVENLQKVVNAFASDAIRGRPCKIINSKGACLDTEYRLDNSLQNLLVFTPGANRSSVEVHCNIGRIQDIHTYAGDGPSCFEPAVIQSVGNERDLENLMMATFMDTAGVATCFCLVEVSSDRRDAFLQSMRVLGIYAQRKGVINARPAEGCGAPEVELGPGRQTIV